MFQRDRRALREYYFQAWQKRHDIIVTDLEKSIIAVIQAHPEYQYLFENHPQDNLDQDFSFFNGQENPFLHLSLHLGLDDQIKLNHPRGIKQIYQHELEKGKKEPHYLQHEMMSVLEEVLWQTATGVYQQDEVDKRYLTLLKNRFSLEEKDSIGA